VKGDANWINELSSVMDKYNNTVHSTIKMKPIEASKTENSAQIAKQFNDKRKFPPPKYKVGDYVRMPDKKHVFSKGYTTNWGYELFRIKEVLKTKPPTYIIKDEKDDTILGKHYEQELQKSKFNFISNRSVLQSMNILLK
jgi:hypothetical protein